MRRMNVAHFEAGAIAAQTARPEGGETTLVRQFGERVRLIHELRELRTAEEITHDCAKRLWVDQLLRRHAVDVDVEQRHALFDEPLRAGETDAALVGEQFTDRADAAAAEMIDVIERAFATAQVDQIFDRRDEILVGQNAFPEINVDAEFLVELVTSNAAEIIFLWIKKESLQEGTRVRHGRRIARAQLAINVLERLFLVMRRILFQRLHDGVVMRDVDHLHLLMAERHNLANRSEGERLEGARDGHFTIEHVGREHLGRETFLVEFLAQLQLLDIVKKLDDLFVRSVTEGAEERGREEFPAAFAAIEIDVKQVAGVELHLDP